MNDASVHYTKLPGPSAGWSGRTRLWLAEDHLLEVNSTLFTERYHRFFLHDIRSVLAQRTKAGFYWNVALGILSALGLGIAGLFYWAGTKFPDNDGFAVAVVQAALEGERGHQGGGRDCTDSMCGTIFPRSRSARRRRVGEAMRREPAVVWM